MVEQLRQIILGLLAAKGAPIAVAVDGPSGAGKSTVARALAAVLPATVVPSDDFFAADLTRAEWDARGAAERARDAIDWVRLRRYALEPLRAGQPAAWHPFDFIGGERADGSYRIATHVEQREPAAVILVEGAYSSRPELADILDLTVFIDAPEHVRHARLRDREDAAFLEAWHRRWDQAEAYYFANVRPPQSFDVVVDVSHGCAVNSCRIPLQPG